MSEFARMRELAALLRAPELVEPIIEAQNTSAFDGLKTIVEEAIEDLEHKLCEGGALETLLDKHGLSGLDKHKDRDGKTMLERLDIRTKQYKKEVLGILLEIELMLASDLKEGLNEMADINQFRSGWFKTSQAKDLVKAFRAGEETVEVKGQSFKAVKAMNVKALAAGMVVTAAYNSTNQGMDIVEVLGFNDGTGDTDKVQYKSMKEMLADKKVSSLKDVEDARMVVKDLTGGDQGGWYYQYEGRFARGSGAEKLTFTLVEKV